MFRDDVHALALALALIHVPITAIVIPVRILVPALVPTIREDIAVTLAALVILALVITVMIRNHTRDLVLPQIVITVTIIPHLAICGNIYEGISYCRERSES